MNIRHGTIYDISALTRLKHPRSEERRRALDEGQAERLTAAAKGNAAYLVIEDGDEIVGHVFLVFEGAPSAPDYPTMEDLYVRDDRRGQGNGGLLIAACERLAVDHGFSRIGLAVNPQQNARARALYERLGYGDLGRPSYLDGVYNGVEDWVIDMAKQL